MGAPWRSHSGGALPKQGVVTERWRHAARDPDDEGVPEERIVLLADADADTRETIAYHLALAGYPVVQAGSVDGAVEELHRLRPDVIVLSDDLGADRSVGDVIALLDDESAGGHVPVITLSDDPGRERLTECLAVGARDHVRRDEAEAELLPRIGAVLRVDDELERLRQRNAELEFAVGLDPVTGMANRRGLEDELERLAAGAARHHLALSAVMARAAVPAATGTPVAREQRQDGLRRELGYLVSSVRRADDIAGVWDPRTFALLLPLTAAGGACVLAERLRAAVAAAPVQYRDEDVAVTMSCAFVDVGADTGQVFPALEAAVARVEADGGDAVAPA
jgi:PleD family two-component response regulator